jgi:hypothetical protein
MGGLLNPPKPWAQTNAWLSKNVNALQYNTSIAGTVVPIVIGTTRAGVNLLDLQNYMGPGGGKKGKAVGPLPLTGTDMQGGGKGGGGSKKSTGKKSGNYSVDVSFGICQGPVTVNSDSLVFAGGSVANFADIGANFYPGDDGQAPDPTFASYGDISGNSGTCYITVTPMNLGQSPVLPNINVEISGFQAGTSGFGPDANPGLAVQEFLLDDRWGVDFPAAYLDTGSTADYGNYCQAVGFGVSVLLSGQTEAQQYLAQLARLTNTAICWSDATLKFIPYGDVSVTNNMVTWNPNLVPEYSLTDDHFLPWNPHIQDDGSPEEGQDDPILITRASAADIVNYLTIEYLDRSNFYNATTYAVFDQGSIDQFGVRSGENLQGHIFCTAESAQTSAQILMQRLSYIRNTYKFKVGWQFQCLELMDIVLLTESISGLNQFPVRITAMDENENGDLTIEAEEFGGIGVPAPFISPPAQPPPSIINVGNGRIVVDTGGPPYTEAVPTVSSGPSLPLVSANAGDYLVLVSSSENPPGFFGASAIATITGNGVIWNRFFSTFLKFDDAFAGTAFACLEVWGGIVPADISSAIFELQYGQVARSAVFGIVAFRDVDVNNPWDGDFVWAGGPSPTSILTPKVTTSANGIVLGAFANYQNPLLNYAESPGAGFNTLHITGPSGANPAGGWADATVDVAGSNLSGSWNSLVGEYVITNAPESGLTVSWGFNVGAWLGVGMALRGRSS